MSYGPSVRGELTVRRTLQGWQAGIAGVDVAVRRTSDSVQLLVPGGQGEFRGLVTRGGAAITGFWIQPPGVVAGVAYASPLQLDRVPAGPGQSAWEGTVIPHDERFSLYLIVSRDSDGTLLGSFHNPEANSRGGAATFVLQRSGSAVRFTDVRAAPAALPALVGTYDTAQRELIVPWGDIGRPIVLTRRGRDEAVGLYPRTPAGSDVGYRVPLPGDGWPVARASSVGLDEARLAALVQHVADGNPALDTTPLIQSILIARHGKLVLDEYFFGFDRWRTHDVRSASKTFASVLLGAVMLHGGSVSPATHVYAALRAAGPFANPDPRKAQITVGELLTHSTGLACDDNGDSEPGNEDAMQSQHAQPDWYTYTLDLPMRHDPGQHYAYCSATMNLVGGVLAAAERAWLPALFDRWVAAPLQFGRYYVNLMPTGQAYFGGGMQLLPRDLLKLGVTYLQGGVWNGQRIVSRAWVAESTSPQIGPPAAATPDGYGWHLHPLTSGGRTIREYEANGNGGQFLIVLPDLDMAVVITGADYGRYGVWRQWRDVLVPDYLIPAATGS